MVINWFPLSTFVVIQYLHSVWKISVSLEDKNANTVLEGSLGKLVCILHEKIAKIENLENNATEQCITERNEKKITTLMENRNDWRNQPKELYISSMVQTLAKEARGTNTETKLCAD